MSLKADADDIREYLKGFLARKGSSILAATLLDKVLRVALVVIVVRLLAKEDFGLAAYAMSVVGTAVPLSGGGTGMALLRFGATERTRKQKLGLLWYTLTRGLAASLLPAGLVVVTVTVTTKALPAAAPLVMVYALYIVTSHLSTGIRNGLRVLLLNKAYAIAVVSEAGAVCVLGVVGAKVMGAVGYLLGVALSPILVGIVWLPRLCLLAVRARGLRGGPPGGFWRYAVYAALGLAVSQLLYTLDLVILGHLAKDSTGPAAYRVGSVIPYNLLVLPMVFIATDFVSIAKESRDYRAISRYVGQYARLFGGGAVLLTALCWAFGGPVLEFAFGAEYSGSSGVLSILMIGLIGCFTLRIPLGNILSAMGRTVFNFVNAAIALATSVGMSLWLVPHMGIEGTAVATATTMWSSGLLSLAYLAFVFRKHPQKQTIGPNAEVR